MRQADRRPSPLPWRTTGQAHTSAGELSVSRGEKSAGKMGVPGRGLLMVLGHCAWRCLHFFQHLYNEQGPYGRTDVGLNRRA